MTNQSYINDLAQSLSGVRAFCRLGLSGQEACLSTESIISFSMNNINL